MYNDGVNPFKGRVLPDASNIREEMAATLYVRFTNLRRVFNTDLSNCVCLTLGDKCVGNQGTQKNDCYCTSNGTRSHSAKSESETSKEV